MNNTLIIKSIEKEEIICFSNGHSFCFLFCFLFLSNICNEDRIFTEKEILWIKVCIFVFT